MTEPHDPDHPSWKPPLTARRENLSAARAHRLVSWATPSMPSRARARHFTSIADARRVRPVRSAASHQQRVMVKVRVVRMTPGAKKALMTHVRYVARDGAGADGQQGEFFDARKDVADAQAFAWRCEYDRHHFRLIVNPEDGRDIPDLTAFTRRLMTQVETDMGTTLDWVAGAHYDTGRPHLHILLRGKRDDGRDLVLPRDYVSHGLRQRSQELATEILGPRQERAPTKLEVTADRLTPMDLTLIDRVQDGRLTLEQLPEIQHSDALRRLVHLETRGWIQREGAGSWKVPVDLRETLQQVGDREAQGAAAAKAILRGPWREQLDRLEPLELWVDEMVVGAYAGLHHVGPYRNGPQVLVMETIDGRLGHVRLPSLESALILDRVPERAIIAVRGKARPEKASDRTIAEIAADRGGVYSAADHQAARPADNPAFIERHVRRLEAKSREGACQALGDGRFVIPPDYVAKASAADQARHGEVDPVVRVLDVRPLEMQPRAQGVTWLDNLAAGIAIEPKGGALADEARALGVKRAAVRQSWGIGTGELTVLSKQDWKKLLNLEFRSQAERLCKGGKPLLLAREGERFSGVYIDRTHIAGYTHAVIESPTAVILAPWRPALEGGRGQMLTGMMRGGEVDFHLGRQRGMGLEL